MIRIYGKHETDFTGNGLAVLNEAKDVHITRKINGDYSLDFSYPLHSEKWENINNTNICKIEGQCFRITQIDEESVHAVAIYRDMQHKHIQYIADMIGKTPRNIMLHIFDGTPIHIMTESEVNALGMEWVTDATDFFEASKTTPIECLKTLTSTLEKQKAVCELYIDNYNLALVKSLGRDYSGEISLRFNAKDTSSSRDTSSMITRLYPYGADDLDISTENDGVQYIDSPLIEQANAITYEGYAMFDECEDPAELLELAKWQFSEENLERIDTPKYNMNVGFVDVSQVYKKHGLDAPKLGDRVKIYDEQLKTKIKQRIIGSVIYPFESKKSTIEVGQARITMESFFNGLCQTQIQQFKQTNGKKEIKTAYLEMMMQNLKVSINEALQNEDIAKYKTGALFESPDGSCAVAIIKGQLAIAAGKTDGEWDWTTVINDNEVIVSEVFTGALYTNMCTVLSDNGKLTIEDSLITMKDSKDVVRFECGYSCGEYVFRLYNAKGEKTVYINDDGDAVFAGKLETLKDASVGKVLTIGATDEDISTLLFQGETNSTEITNDDINKIFKISPSFAGDLVITEEGIKFNGSKLSTANSVSGIVNAAINEHIKEYHNNS